MRWSSTGSVNGAVERAGASEGPSKPESRKWVLAATILGSSMAFIDGTVINVALPALQSSLHATVVDVQWVVESYGLFLSALILVGGALGDSVGRRKMFLAGVAVFAGASLGCGFSSSIHTLVLWRCIQGVGAAFLVPLQATLQDAPAEDKRGTVISASNLLNNLFGIASTATHADSATTTVWPISNSPSWRATLRP